MVFDVDRISHLKLKALSWILWFSRSSVHLCSADRGDRVASDGASSVLVPSPDPESPPNVVDQLAQPLSAFADAFPRQTTSWNVPFIVTEAAGERAVGVHRGPDGPSGCSTRIAQGR